MEEGVPPPDGAEDAPAAAQPKPPISSGDVAWEEQRVGARFGGLRLGPSGQQFEDLLWQALTDTFCGLSMGGYIAWQFLRKYPERVDALVLCNTRAAADTPETRAELESVTVTMTDGTQYEAEVVGRRRRQEAPHTPARELLGRGEAGRHPDEQRPLAGCPERIPDGGLLDRQGGGDLQPLPAATD